MGAPCGLDVNVLSTVNAECHVPHKRRQGFKGISFSFGNQCVTGVGGFRLIACVRKNEKLNHRCN